MAWVAILWICGYAGTVQQTKSDTGIVMYTHMGLHMVNEITWIELMNMMPDILRMRRFQEWDPGEMDTYSEMYLHKGMHRVHMTKEVIWRYVITGMVMEWDTKQQCHERAMPGGLFKEDEIPGIRQQYENNTVVWDTGQQAHMDQIARVDQDTVDQSASFGWCTNVRGTDAEGDATSLKNYASQEMVGHGGQYHRQHQAGQRPHHHQGGGHGGRHQQEARHSHLQQQGGHSLLPRPAGEQTEQQAGRGHGQQRHLVLSQDGRPPEGSSGSEYKYDDIGLKISFRNRFEQNPSVLDGGGASLVVRCRLQEERNKVYCRVTFRFSTWTEVHASTDTLVGQPPYLETRGWEEVVPFGD